MGLPIRCPKCETDVQAGARRCPLCATPLRLEGFKPGKPEEGPSVIDPLLDLFERDDVVRMCTRCFAEHVGESKRCSKCRLALVSTTRTVMEAAILERPIATRSQRSMAPPRKVPPDLVRVDVSAGPDEANRHMEAMRFLGIEVWPGSDSLDADPDSAAIGLYVRRHELTVARYVLEGPGAEPTDLFDRDAVKQLDARTRALSTARAYLRFEKFRRVVEMLEPLTIDPEAQDLMAEALLGCGRIREAERRAEVASAELVPGSGRARARFLAGVLAALGHDGSVAGAGSRMNLAIERLRESTAESPRDLEAGKALVECLLWDAQSSEAKKELERLRLINANVTGLDGYWRTQWLELRQRV